MSNRFDRVWDEADYVVPPAENGAFFITTNVLVTPNQTQSRCPENNKVKLTQIQNHYTLSCNCFKNVDEKLSLSYPIIFVSSHFVIQINLIRIRIRNALRTSSQSSEMR